LPSWQLDPGRYLETSSHRVLNEKVNPAFAESSLFVITLPWPAGVFETGPPRGFSEKRTSKLA
jgi:hypothetical protein